MGSETYLQTYKKKLKKNPHISDKIFFLLQTIKKGNERGSE